MLRARILRPDPSRSHSYEGVPTVARRLISAASWPAWLYSLLVVTSMVVGNRVVYGGWVSVSLGRTYFGDLGAFDMATWLMGVPLCAAAVLRLDRELQRSLSARWKNGLTWQGPDSAVVVTLRAGLLLLAWAPYLLTYYPGSVLPDTIGQLSLSPGAWTNHHPVAYTWLLKAFATGGERLGDVNYGVFALALTQSILMAGILAFIISRLTRWGLPRIGATALTIYFALVPVFPIYALNLQKDTLFSLAIAMLTMFAFEAVATGGALLRRPLGFASFAMISTMTVFLRNNGIFVVTGCVLSLAYAYRGRPRRFFIGAAALLILSMLVLGPGFDRLGIAKDTIVESLGVPIQQIAYTLSIDGETTEAQRSFLARLLPLEHWQSSYAPALVDPIKWHDEFDADLLERQRGQFLETWLQLLRANPTAFAKAYGLVTFGFWKPGAKDRYGWADTYVAENTLGIRATDVMERLTGASLKPTLDGARGPHGTGGFVSVGVSWWLIMLALTMVLLQRRPRFVSVFVPCAVLWLTIMAATPVAFSLRYVFAFALCLPGLLMVPFFTALLGDAHNESPA